MFRRTATMFTWLALIFGAVVSEASAQQDNSLTLIPAQAQVTQNGQVQIDVFVENVTALRAYEVWLDITPGTGGTLTAADVSVNTGRNDYVFFGDAADQCGTSVASLLAACASSDESGVDVGTTPKYLATYIFEASADAAGEFNIDFTSSTALIDSGFNDIVPLDFLEGATVTVGGGTGPSVISTSPEDASIHPWGCSLTTAVISFSEDVRGPGGVLLSMSDFEIDEGTIEISGFVYDGNTFVASVDFVPLEDVAWHTIRVSGAIEDINGDKLVGNTTGGAAGSNDYWVDVAVVRGDFQQDRDVDVFDRTQFIVCWTDLIGEIGDLLACDHQCDGDVDVFDRTQFLAAWTLNVGETLGPAPGH